MNLSNLKVPPPVVDYARAERDRANRAARKAMITDFLIFALLIGAAMAGYFVCNG